MGNNDATLFSAWRRERDPQAFRALAERHGAMVFATCRRVLKNSAEAQDVTQECFELLATYQGPRIKHIAGWLHRVATTRSLNRLRSERTRRAREIRYAEENGHVESDWAEAYQRLDEELAQLPDRYRTVIVAHFFEGQSHEAIAKDLGVSRQTVTYRLGKALALLRAALGKRGAVISTAALSSALAAEAEAAMPPALHAALGKVALAASQMTPSASVLSRLAEVGSTTAGRAIAAVIVGVVGAVTALTVLPDSRPEADISPSVGSIGADALRNNASATTPLPSTRNPGLARITGEVFDQTSGAPVAGLELQLVDSSGDVAATTIPDQRGRFAFETLAPGEYSVHFPFIQSFNMLLPGSEPRIEAVAEKASHVRLPIKAYVPANQEPFALRGRVVDGEGRPVPGAVVAILRYHEPYYLLTSPDGTFKDYARTSDPGPGLPAIHYQAKTANLESEVVGPVVVPREGLHDCVATLAIEPNASVEGIVVDHDDNPVPGAIVSLRRDDQPTLFEHGRTIAGDGGRFSISGLAPGDYVASVIQVGPDDFRVPNKAANVTLGDSERLTNLRLTSLPGHLMNWAGAPPEGQWTVEGVLYDAEGEAIPGAQVFLATDPGSEQVRAAQTDDRGRFVFDALNHGLVGLYAMTRDGEARAEVQAGTKGVALMALRESEVAYACRVVDEGTWAPIENFRVATSPRYHTQPWDRAMTHTKPESDPHGRFIARRKADHHGISILVHADGYAPEVIAFHATDAVPAQEILFRLKPGRAFKGRVVNTDGEPVEGAAVYYGAIPYGDNFRDAAAVSDASGQFSIPDFPFGTEMLSAIHPDYAAGETWLADASTITLPEPCKVAVEVRVAGAPMKSVSVDATPPSALRGFTRIFDRTGPNGIATLTALPPGPVLLQAKLPGGLRVQKRHVIEADGAEVRFDVANPSALLKCNFRAGVQPESGTAYLYLDRGSYQERYAVMVRGSEFRFPSVAPGTGVLQVRYTDDGVYRHLRVPDITIYDEEFLEMELAVAEPGSVSGVCYGKADQQAVSIHAVYGAKSAEDAAAEIRFGDVTPDYGPVRNADAAGSYRFEALSPGTYTLIAVLRPNSESRRQLAQAATVVEVASGEDLTVDFDFR